MRIAIVGYGRMGHEVEHVARARGHEIARLIDPELAASAGASAVTPDALDGCDVAIEFSLADAVRDNVRAYVDAGIPAVLGTTGWLAHLDEVEQLVDAGSGALVYGANFSIGANLFFRLAAYAGSLVREVDEYDLMIHEMHHRGKKDSPSGTALTLARAVLEQVPRKDTIETGRLDRPPSPNELHVSSTRGGSVPGTHTLYLDSDADSIEVTHRARNRGGFALGAVRAAEWIVGRRGVFTVAQFIDSLVETD